MDSAYHEGTPSESRDREPALTPIDTPPRGRGSLCTSESEPCAAQVAPSPDIGGPRECPEPSDRPLPIELYRAIFIFVRAESQATAARLPRLCQSLRHEAEDVLYHTPLLRTKDRAMTFGKTVSACPRRANAVRGLAFNAWRGWEDKAAFVEHRYQRFYEQLRLGVAQDRFEQLRRDMLETEVEPDWATELRSSLAHLRRLSTIVIQQPGARHVVFLLLRGLDIPLRRIKGTRVSHHDLLTRQYPELEEVHLHGDPEPLAFMELPSLRVLSCQSRMLTHPGHACCRSLTHLNVTKVTSEDIDKIIHAFGPQLVSLRLEQMVWHERGRLYPTNGPMWRRCTRLKYLHVRHYEWRHDMTRYLQDDPINATNLPPSLQTLVWSPAWTRVFTYHIYPDADKRADIRRFAEAVLRGSRTLKAVIYEWTRQRSYKCYLTHTNEYKEIKAADMDEEEWTRG